MSKFFKSRKNSGEIDFENVFFDSKNVAGMNTQQMQGVIERPITKVALYSVFVFTLLVMALYSFKLYELQIVSGEELYLASEDNATQYDIIFNRRGVIYDRNDFELAWNEFSEEHDFALRRYVDTPGFSHLLGYVTYPQKDANNKYFDIEYNGISGIEFAYDEILNGQVGFRAKKQDVFRNPITGTILQEGIDGLNINLTVDADLQARLHKELARYIEEQGFDGASGVIIDVHTGEILALTNVPEYNSNILADGEDRQTIASYNTDPQKPFLNRALGGSYAPGSVVKPFVAAGVLDKDLVSPYFRLVTNGTLIVPNRFGGPPTYFRDARNNGVVNMIDAIAKSSNIYFFTFGGGFGNHSGLGIYGMKEYYDLFGFGQKTGLEEFNEQSGFVPTPEWKQDTFGERWLLGDTYFTAIGQYSFLATPLQLVMATGAIATKGTLLEPQIVLNKNQKPIPQVRRVLDISLEDFDIVHQGMRQVVLHPKGTARSLNLPYISVAAKTGTAERGFKRSKQNSWTIGFWPYENPKYAFVVMAENGPSTNKLGVSRTMTRMFQGMYADGVTNYFE